MSFKHLFNKTETLKSLADKSAQEIGDTIESPEFQEQDIIKEARFLPPVDYASASNFARYGLAENYYRDSIDRIVKQYPYDGSLRERLQWENESSEIDLHIYDNLYPRSTGYAVLAAEGWGSAVGALKDGYRLPSTLEYIHLKGGPHPHPEGMSPLYQQFTGSNYYETGSNRESNLKYDLGSSGVTVEFWLSKTEWVNSLTEKEAIFDMWNGVSNALSDYGRLRVSLNYNNEGSSPFSITALSGTTGITEQAVGSNLTVADGKWHHYAISLMSASAGISTKLYVDGNLNHDTTLGSAGINEVTGALEAYIGALISNPDNGTSLSPGAGKMSASLDEFRYWKTNRSSQDIGRHWFTQVAGGTNVDPKPFKDTVGTGNTDLGVYYKFNEGITGKTATDSTILDYSGRVTNAAWTGYTTNSRNTGSAIISSSAATKEFEDPVIYSFHPDVSTLRTNLIQSGSEHDISNPSAMYKTLPSWITEEDATSGEHIRKMTQIMSSYFDTLHLQIEALNKLKDVEYVSGSNKATVYGDKLLTSQGLVVPELFVDAGVLEKLADRSEERVFEKSLTEVKNLIYQNIYNNLSYTYKSKGTEKAFRNVIRAFGVDDELVKINMYANNTEFDFSTNRKNQVLAKKYVSFNTVSNANASVFQLRDPGDTTNTSGFISASTELTGGYALTLQSEIQLPKKFSRSDDWYLDTNMISASLFGVHSTTVQPDEAAGLEGAQTDTTIPVDNATNFQVLAVRDTLDSSNTQFILTGSSGGYVPRLTSSLYLDAYNNTNWSLAVKIYPERYPWLGQVANTSTDNYIVEFEGVQIDAGITINSFNVTGTVASPPASFISGSRRVFIGANKTNVTGAIIHRTDVKVGSCRLWLDKLTTETVEAHAHDVQNHGRTDTLAYPFPFQSSASYGDLISADTLLLNWNFDQNTGSNASGEFRVSDLSSGSATEATDRQSWLGNILYYQHPAKGTDFEVSTSKVTDKIYIVNSKQNLPETLESSDMITVMSQQDDVKFSRDSRPQNYFLAFEKSMQQAVSEEMINYFASLKDLNTIIGAPVNRYRGEYKGLKYMRQRFFETVSNNEIDFEKFFEYYKWIDSALGTLLAQLAPISLDFDPNIRTLIESHILERSKYQNKLPFLAKSVPGPETGISGTIGTLARPSTANSDINNTRGNGLRSTRAPSRRITGMPNTVGLGNWKYDHAPPPTASWADGARPQQNSSSTWWQNRAERGGLSDLQNLNATGVMPSQALADRQVLLDAIRVSNNRILNRPYRFNADGAVVLGGVAHHPNKSKDVVYEATRPMGPTVGALREVPANVMVALSEDVEQLLDTTDEYSPSHKIRYGFDVGMHSSSLDTIETENYEINAAGSRVMPFSLYSASLNDSLSDEIANFTGSTIITNMHTDLGSTRTDVPMQGPFTERFVGGREHRHVSLNQSSSKNPAASGLDTRENRPEAYRIMTGYEYTGSTGATSPWRTASGRLMVVSPQHPELDTAAGTLNLNDRPKAILAREEYAKRPVNIKNILMTTSSLSQSMSGTIAHSSIGNYTKNYEVVQTSGRTQNDPYFRDQSFDFATTPETLATRGRFPLYEPDPIIGKSYLFDGSNDYASSEAYTAATWNTLIGSSSAGGTKPYSMSVWIYVNTWSGNDAVIAIGRTAYLPGGREIRLYDSGGFNLGIRGVVGGNNYKSSDTDMVTGQWYHITVTYAGMAVGYDGSTVLPDIYVDGADDGDAGNISTLSHVQSIATIPLQLGYNATPGNGYFDGYMCDVAIYDKELSSAEVTELYNGGQRSNPLQSSFAGNTLVYYPMGNLSADDQKIINDLAGNDDLDFRDSLEPIRSASPSNLSGEQFPSLAGPLNKVTANTGGDLNYTLPARTGSASNQTVIVNRFAGSGYEVMSRGYMDPAHEEMSVYNANPYHNLSIRDSGLSGSASVDPLAARTITIIDQIDKNRGLDQRYSLHSGKFGADSAYGEITLAEAQADATLDITQPSFHKIQRNGRRRLIITGSMLGAAGVGSNQQNLTSDQPLTTASVYDNAFVQHPIPQSDRNYMWITSSLGNGATLFGYDKKVSPPTGSAYVYELSTALITGPSGSSGSMYVTGAYPYRTGSAPSAHEPPYTTLIESGNINFAGFAYSDHAMRYANLDTHTLEPPNYQPNLMSYLFSGSRLNGAAIVDADGVTNGVYSSLFQAGDAGSFQAISKTEHHTTEYPGMSVSFWIKPNYTGSLAEDEAEHMTPFQFINRWRSASRRRVWLEPRLNSTGLTSTATQPGYWEIRWFVDGNASNGEIFSGTNIPNNVWTHVVVTYDGSDPNNNAAATLAAMKIYINGEVEAGLGLTPLNDPLGLDGPLFIGNEGRLDRSRPFNGNLDEMQIWFGALSATSVRELYDRRGFNLFNYKPAANGRTTEARLMSSYRFGNNVGDTTSYISDQQGNADAVQIGTVTSLSGTTVSLDTNYGTGLTDSNITLNHSTLNLNGPYQHPTWKQIRTGEHPVARAMRSKNRISVADPPPMVAEYISGSTNPINMVRGKSSITFTDYTEYPVVSRYNPIFVAFDHPGEGEGNKVSADISFGNSLTYFTNNGLNNRLNITIEPDSNQAYKEVAEYIHSTGEDNVEVYASYGEQIYPAEQNTYGKKNRYRTEYKIQNIWDDVRARRSLPTTNSQGSWVDPGDSKLNNTSPWPLDAPTFYTESTSSFGYEKSSGTKELDNGVQNTASVFTSGIGVPASTGAVGYYAGFTNQNMLTDGISSLFNNLITAGTGSGAGELQNTYVHFARHPGARSAGSGDALDGWMTGTIRPGPAYIQPIVDLALPSAAPGGTYRNSKLLGFHPWVAPYQKSISPYKPYRDYAANIAHAGKDSSIVPEFRISEHLEQYLGSLSYTRSKDGFLDRLPNLLSLTGAAISDSGQNNFYKVYSNTDFLELFKIVDADLTAPRQGQKEHNGEMDLIRHGTTLKATAFISFLPYKGFYPAERTVSLASYFSQSMGTFLPATRSYDVSSSLPIEGTSAPMATVNESLSRILVTPLFSPGILFNTIKSGIAVSNFVVRNTASNPGVSTSSLEHLATPRIELGMLYRSARRNDTDMAAYQSADPSWRYNIISLDNYYEYNFNSSASVQSASLLSCSLRPLNIGTSGNASALAFIASKVQGGSEQIILESRYGHYLHKVPFEAIRKPQEYLSWRALSGEKGMPSVRWDSGSLEGTGSGPNSPARGLGAGWMYDIFPATPGASGSLAKSVGYQGPLGDDRKAKIRWDGQMSSPLYELAIDNFLCETVNFFQEGLTSYISAEETEFKPVTKNDYYGMRVTLYRTNDDAGNPNFGMYSRATAFGQPLDVSGSRGAAITMAHVTPPYYNGQATADIIYKAGFSDRPALQDIISTAIVEYNRDVETNIRAGTWGSILTGSNTSGALSSSVIGTVTGSLHEDYVHNQMQISASINLFDKVLAVPEGTAEQKTRWLIQTKFETPVLNFYDTPSLPHPTSSMGAGNQPIDVTSSTAPFQIRGMWHQYGNIPSGSEGVFFGVQDLPTTYSSSHYSGDIKINSLKDIVGFETVGDQRIGRLAEAKTISEGVVCVPFVVRNNRRHFVRLPAVRYLERAKQFVTTRQQRAVRASDEEKARLNASVELWKDYSNVYDQQVNLFNKYVFPPTMDYITNPTVSPLFFVAFEFEETFSQTDLQNMWQNLPPESNEKFKKVTSEIHIPRTFTNKMFNRETDLQWVIFKVKQRAASDYSIFSKQGLTESQPIVSPSINSPYSFNWPYDYFSLVELLKIDESVEYVSKKTSQGVPWEDPLEDPTHD